MRVLNVAEKPSVAKEISAILSQGGCRRRAGQSQYNAIFEFPYQINNQNVDMAFTSVTGHLMELEFSPSIDSHLHHEGYAYSCRQWLVLWLDCDREGENIAFEVKSVCENVNRRLRVFRARFSALIPRDIQHAVQHLVQPNENLSLACDARSEIDLRLGAAFTRFQTMRIQKKFPRIHTQNAASSSSSSNTDNKVVSFGSCQFPTLGFVVDRFLAIEAFVSEPFYSIHVAHAIPDVGSIAFTWARHRLYDHVATLALFEMCVEAKVATVTSITRKDTSKRKPFPLTTVEFQKRASRWLRITSEEAMAAAESLYNKGLLSYPRTETDSFKEGTDLTALLTLHLTHDTWGGYVGQLLHHAKYEHPRTGKHDDHAHPPIHPTKSVALTSLHDKERKVYEFVTLHFLACCSMDAKGHQTTVHMQMADERFSASGLMILARNYLDIYRFESWSNSVIPVYDKGDVFVPTALTLQAGETAPPPLLTESDLIAKMDMHGIGTDATIAEHINTILKREYSIKVNNNTQFKPTGTSESFVYTTFGDIYIIYCYTKSLDDPSTLFLSCPRCMKTYGLPMHSSVVAMANTFCPLCHFQVVEIHRVTNPQHPYPVCPHCFNHPPNPRLQEMACFSCAAPACALATGAQDQCVVQFCPCCRSHPMKLKRTKTAKFTVGCVDYPACTTSVWLPSAVKVAVVTTALCPACSNVHQMIYKLRLRFAPGALPPDVHQGTSNDDNGEVDGFYEACLFCDPLLQQLFAIRLPLSSTSRLPGTPAAAMPRPQIDQSYARMTAGRTSANNNNEYMQSITNPGKKRTRTPKPTNGASGRNDDDGRRSDVPMCPGHQTACATREVRKDNENKGRKFYCCSYPQGEQCEFFLWVDAADTYTVPASSSSSTSGGASRSKKKPKAGAASNQVTCTCGAPALELTSRTANNNGRVFYKCAKQADNCN
ncbi:hypothetical protein DYB36_000067, partial [Aphanomyces astaci]